MASLIFLSELYLLLFNNSLYLYNINQSPLSLYSKSRTLSMICPTFTIEILLHYFENPFKNRALTKKFD